MSYEAPIEKQTKAALLIGQAIEAAGNAGDDELKLDCIEGQTDLFEQIDLILKDEHDADAMSKAVAQQVKELQERKKRLERKRDMRRFLLQQVVQILGIRKLERANGTVSLRPGGVSVLIEDEDLLPDKFFKVERTPSKSAIKDALDSGVEVPGAKLVTGEETISIRRA